MMMVVKIILLLCIVASSSLLRAADIEASKLPAVQSKAPIEVAFNVKGKTFNFTAKVESNRFIFNEGGGKTVNIATLDWPPYVGRDLCNLGWSLQLAIAILTAKDYRVNVHFYPWIRAVMMVESGNFEILYPEYFIEDTAPSDIFPDNKRRELLVQSNEIIGGNIAFLKRKTDAFVYDNNLSSIQGKKVGVVRGYQNTPEFDALMDEGLISVVKANNEAQLLKLLIAKRVDLIIGDPSVFEYVLYNDNFTEAEQATISEGIEEVAPALKYNHLYFAVSIKYPQWRTLLADINLSIIDFQTSGEIQRIYQQGSYCGKAED